MKRPARRFGKLIVTTTRQPGGQPWVDRGTSTDAEGNYYKSVTICPSLQRRAFNRGPQTGLTVGWRTS